MNLLWTDFLNSMWHDWRGGGPSADRLEESQWLKDFLSGHHLHAPVPPESADLAALKAFRTWLHDLVTATANGDPVHGSAQTELNRIMAAGPVTRQLHGNQITLVPTRHDWAQAMAEVAASFANTLAEGEAVRIRFCDNPDCKWVFYDDTRSRTKRFCDDKMCGNLMKVRRFRARQKEASQAPDSTTSG